MPEQARKMSEIMKDMSETLLRNPGSVSSSEAAHVALFFANMAWNESVGLDHARDAYRNVWETIEAEKGHLGREKVVLVREQFDREVVGQEFDLSRIRESGRFDASEGLLDDGDRNPH